MEGMRMKLSLNFNSTVNAGLLQKVVEALEKTQA